MLKKVLFFLVCFVSLHAMEPEVPTLAALCYKATASYLINNVTALDKSIWKDLKAWDHIDSERNNYLKNELLKATPVTSHLLCTIPKEAKFSANGNQLLFFSDSNSEQAAFSYTDLKILDPVAGTQLTLEDPKSSKICFNGQVPTQKLKIINWYKKGKYIFVESGNDDNWYQQLDTAMIHVWHSKKGTYVGGITKYDYKRRDEQLKVLDDGEKIALQRVICFLFETRYYHAGNLKKPIEIFTLKNDLPWNLNQRIQDPQNTCVVVDSREYDEERTQKMFLYDLTRKTFSPPILNTNSSNVLTFNADGSHFIVREAYNRLAVYDRYGVLIKSFEMDNDHYGKWDGVNGLTFEFNKDNSTIAVRSRLKDIIYNLTDENQPTILNHPNYFSNDVKEYALQGLNHKLCLRFMEEHRKKETTELIIKSIQTNEEIYKTSFKGISGYVRLLNDTIVAISTWGPKVRLFDLKTRLFESLKTTQARFEHWQSHSKGEMVVPLIVSKDGIFLKRTSPEDGPIEIRQFIDASTITGILKSVKKVKQEAKIDYSYINNCSIS